MRDLDDDHDDDKYDFHEDDEVADISYLSIIHEKALKHLEDVEDDQGQGASLLQEEHVEDQPDGEQVEGEAERGD